MKNLRLRLAAVAIALIAVGASSEVARAVVTAGGDIIIVKERVTGDFLAAGKSVAIQAAIDGDLTAAGAGVVIEQPVEGYALVAGRKVEVNGPVRNDLWAAGATIDVNAPVGDNAILAGRNVNLNSNAAVRGDARIAAGTATIEAPIERNLNIVARTARLDSEIGGTVEASVQRLTVLPGTLIRGDLLVHGPYPPDISPEAKVLGQVRFNEVAARSQWSWLLWWWLFGFAALLILGLVAVALSPLWTDRVAAKIHERPGASALIGLAGLLVTPVVAGLLLFTIIGIPLGLILLALYLVAILLSGVFVAYRVGGWLLERSNRRHAAPWLRMTAGALLVSLLMSLPWIGGITQLVVLLVGFGALLLERRDPGSRLQPVAAVHEQP